MGGSILLMSSPTVKQGSGFRAHDPLDSIVILCKLCWLDSACSIRYRISLCSMACRPVACGAQHEGPLMTGTSQLKRVTHRWWFRVLLLRVAVLTFPKISPSCASFTRVL